MTQTPPVLGSRDGMPELRIERLLAHPPSKVWRAISEPAHLSAWYPFPAHDVDPRVGGVIRFAGSPGSTLEAVITEFEPPRTLAFRIPLAGAVVPGGRETENVIRFDLSPADLPDRPGCRLIFTQLFADRPAAASYAAGWESCLDALVALLRGERAVIAAPSAERHESYLHHFGLDAGHATDTADGWQVRFERQLMMQPPTAVWTGLGADGENPAPRLGGPAPIPATATEIPAGLITAVEPGRLLEYDWIADSRPAGRVRWEIGIGPGGARIVLTQTGPATLPEARATALTTWRARLDALVAQLHTGV